MQHTRIFPNQRHGAKQHQRHLAKPLEEPRPSVLSSPLLQSTTALPPTSLPCITLKPDITFWWAFPYVYPLTYRPLQVVHENVFQKDLWPWKRKERWGKGIAEVGGKAKKSNNKKVPDLNFQKKICPKDSLVFILNLNVLALQSFTVHAMKRKSWHSGHSRQADSAPRIEWRQC